MEGALAPSASAPALQRAASFAGGQPFGQQAQPPQAGGGGIGLPVTARMTAHIRRSQATSGTYWKQ